MVGCRSYAYVWLHALPAVLYRKLVPSVTPIVLFYLVRCCIAAFTAMAEVLQQFLYICWLCFFVFFSKDVVGSGPRFSGFSHGRNLDF